jgi:cytochrome b6-f complex iron-sulfur subunit
MPGRSSDHAWMRLPVISPACPSCTRRQLLHGLGIGVASSLILSACGGGGGGGDGDAMVDTPAGSPDAPNATCPTKDFCIDVTKAPYTSLANANGSAVVSTTAGQLIVVRTSATAVAALSAICTHQGCTVNYQTSSMLLYCPCHGAEFSLTGSVVRSPATVALKTYSASVSGNIITIVLA